MVGELTEVAILAYRAGRYRDAIELLLQVTGKDGSDWFAKLYLAMAFEKTDCMSEAHEQLMLLAQDCTDTQIRAKAEFVLPLVEAAMQRRFKKGASSNSKKVGVNIEICAS